jgi:hypothetical protein
MPASSSTYNKTVIKKYRLSEGTLVVVSIVTMIAAFALLVVFVNAGGVRTFSSAELQKP